MRLLTSKRSNRLRASRLVAALFAIGWLGFAVAPCQAMPHQQQPGSSDHGSMPADGCGGCPRSPSGLDSGCAMVGSPECLSAGPAILGLRDSDFPQPAAGPPLAITGFDAFIPDAVPVRDARVRQSPVPHASIQQRYCSYLN
jgi:hypothetical protein